MPNFHHAFQKNSTLKHFSQKIDFFWSLTMVTNEKFLNPVYTVLQIIALITMLFSKMHYMVQVCNKFLIVKKNLFPDLLLGLHI